MVFSHHRPWKFSKIDPRTRDLLTPEERRHSQENEEAEISGREKGQSREAEERTRTVLELVWGPYPEGLGRVGPCFLIGQWERGAWSRKVSQSSQYYVFPQC